MFMSSRTGSTFLTGLLNSHPRVLFLREHFNYAPFWTAPRKSLGGLTEAEAFFRGNYPRVYRKLQRDYAPQGLAGFVPPKDFGALATVGFKVRCTEAGLWPGSKPWRVLSAVRPRVVCSYRRNHVKATVSDERGRALFEHCRYYNLEGGCALPSNWTIDSWRFEDTLRKRIWDQANFMGICAAAAREFPTLYLAYEDLLADPAGSVDALLRFAGLPEGERAGLVESVRNGSAAGLRKNTPDSLAAVLPPADIARLKEVAARVYAEIPESLF